MVEAFQGVPVDMVVVIRCKVAMALQALVDILPTAKLEITVATRVDASTYSDTKIRLPTLCDVLHLFGVACRKHLAVMRFLATKGVLEFTSSGLECIQSSALDMHTLYCHFNSS